MNQQSVEKTIEGIKQDQVHGASFLAREALRALLQRVQSSQMQSRQTLFGEFLETAKTLIALRPNLPAIGHVVVRATSQIKDACQPLSDPDEIKSKMQDELNQVLAGCRKAHDEGVRHAVQFLKDQSRVLTLSLSSNVQDALLQAGSKLRAIYVAQSQPLREGEQLARILAEAGLPVALITDAAMGKALDDVDLCLVGADGVLQDGSLVNKTGSLLLARAARQCKVPFYSICETYKFHVGAVPFEQEVKAPEEVAKSIPGVKILNAPFEVVPPGLVQGYITELGLITPHLAVQQIRGWQRQLSGKRLFGQW